MQDHKKKMIKKLHITTATTIGRKLYGPSDETSCRRPLLLPFDDSKLPLLHTTSKPTPPPLSLLSCPCQKMQSLVCQLFHFYYSISSSSSPPPTRCALESSFQWRLLTRRCAIYMQNLDAYQRRPLVCVVRTPAVPWLKLCKLKSPWADCSDEMLRAIALTGFAAS